MAVETEPKGRVISIRTPLLSAGRTTNFLVRSDLLAVAIKVYAEGGENTLHAHTTNDHLHMVLEGQATFYDKDGNTTVVDKYEGMYLPRGAYYYFQSTGDTNLVLLSSYAYEAGPNPEGRLDADGNYLHAYSEANKHIEGTPIPGRFFGD
jgi:mannose-6-phosphate isomerase-like protein (cupin superfamily)